MAEKRFRRKPVEVQEEYVDINPSAPWRVDGEPAYPHGRFITAEEFERDYEPTPDPNGWKPIASVPKDGTRILAAFKGQFDWVMFTAWASPDGVTAAGFASPTHWMPLPPAPESGVLVDGGGE